MKDLLFRDDPHLDLEEIAVLLGGEVDGKYIYCPSPGRSADDRSCCVQFSPHTPGRFFIYDTDGPLGRAYAAIKSKLGYLGTRSAHANSANAQRIWEQTQHAAGTVVEQYLRSRAITIPTPSSLRFHRALAHPTGSAWPAMVGGIKKGGQIVAIHRTFLRPDGKGQAPVEPVKMTLGPVRGGALELASVEPELAIAEGIETALSFAQGTGIATWAACFAGGLRTICLPPLVTSVIIAADGDRAGEQAARAAARRLILEGRRVRIAQAPPGKDFNDLLREGRHGGH